MPDTERRRPYTEDGVNLLHLLVVVLKRKKMIIGITLACAVIMIVISLIMTPTYRAETSILPPRPSSSSLSAQVLNQIGGASGLIGSSLGINSQNDIYIGMLKSRTLYDRIIDRFALMELYESEYIEDARMRLDESISVESGNDEIISVSVEDRDPQRAADMANAFIEELKKITQTLAVTEASKRRVFFEEQFSRAKEGLTKSEEAMQSFQEKTGAINMEEQAVVVIESIAVLRAQLAAKEVQLRVMKTYAMPRNPDLQRMEEELRGLKEQLLKLEVESGSHHDSLVPTGSIPKIGTDYIRKLRELKYNETLFELMAKQYEMARVDEAGDATLIQVLDRALPPGKKAKPKRALLVATATFTGFLLSIFAAFFMELLETVSGDPGNKEAIEKIRRYAFPGRRRP